MLFDAPDGPDAPDAPDVNDVGPKRELTARQRLYLRIWTWVSRALGLASLVQAVWIFMWICDPHHFTFRGAPFFIQPRYHLSAMSLPLLLLGADLTGWAMRPTAIGRLLWSLAIYLAGLIAWFLVVLGSLRYLR